MEEAFSQINEIIKISKLFLCPLKAAFFVYYVAQFVYYACSST